MLSANEAGVYAVSADQIFANVLDLIYALAAVTAVIIIIVAGITYASSGGDSAAVTKAKGMIFGSVIGLVIVLLAFTITGFILGRF